MLSPGHSGGLRHRRQGADAEDDVHDVLGDRERRRRPGRRRVSDGGDRAELVDAEVVDERAVRTERLGAHARRRRHEVRRRHLRDVAPCLGGEGALEQRPAELTRPHAPVRAGQRAKAARPERLGEVAERDVAPPVALAREGEDGVGADVDAAARPGS